MALEVTVGEPVDTGEAPKGRATNVFTVEAVVHDDEHPRIAGVFEYLLVYATKDPPFLRAVCIRPRRGLAVGKSRRLTAGQVRDLPLARWESAARAHVGERLRQRADDVLARIDALASPETIVRHLYPGLEESTRPADKRRHRGLVQLASVVLDYTAKQLEGVADPAAAIARERGVNPSTVRSWLHRARKAGLLTK